MMFDTKIAIVVRDDLAVWQKLNVTAFLAGGLCGPSPEIVGLPYEDACGTPYGPLIRQPIMIFQATADELARTRRRAVDRGMVPGVYTSELFATGNDADNRAVVAAVAAADLDLVGLALHDERKAVDKVIKGLALHK